MILKLQGAGIKTVAASSSAAEEVELLLKIAGVYDLLTEYTTSSDTENSKPAPDVIKASLDKIGFDSGQVKLLGDSPYDIVSASKAGIKVVAVRCGGFSDAELKGAEAIYNDPMDVVNNFYESPFAKDR